MDFYKIESCLVADRSLREFFRERETRPFFALIFVERLPTLPTIGVSLLPARDLITKKLSPSKTVAYRDWHDYGLDWDSMEIQKYQFIACNIQFEDKRIGLQFEYELSSTLSPMRYYSFPQGYADAYLALTGDGLFRDTDTSPIALLDVNQFKIFLSSKKVYRESRILAAREFNNTSKYPTSTIKSTNGMSAEAPRRITEKQSNLAGGNTFSREAPSARRPQGPVTNDRNVCLVKTQRRFVEARAEDFFESGNMGTNVESGGQTSGENYKLKGIGDTKITKEPPTLTKAADVLPVKDEMTAEEAGPLCSVCGEHQIEVLFIPCGHATICTGCHGKYVDNTRKTQRENTFTARAEREEGVKCCICRQRITFIAGIWIHGQKCLLCGCSTTNAVAGGQGGCGCLIGCYDKAVELLAAGGSCPFCSAKLVDIVKAYVVGASF